MTLAVELSPDRSTVTISVPLAMRRNGGRKQVVSPTGAAEWSPHHGEVDSTLVKALAELSAGEGSCTKASMPRLPSSPRLRGSTSHM
jgi:hypothetical protein